MKQYDVTGMSCAACSANVEKAVSKVPGVTACSVSLLTNSMGVEGTAGEQAVIAAVEAAGYGASVKGAPAAAAPAADDPLAGLDAAQAQGLGKAFRRFVQTAVGHLEILETDGQTVAVRPGGPVQQRGQMHGPDDAFRVLVPHKMPPPAGALTVVQDIFHGAVQGAGRFRLRRGSHALLQMHAARVGRGLTAHALSSPGPETGGRHQEGRRSAPVEHYREKDQARAVRS